MKELNTILLEAVGTHTPTIVPMIEMLIRSVLIYFTGVIVTRLNKKLLGVRTPFNFILFVMLGSIFATAVIDANLFLPVIGAIFFLTFLNRAISILSFKYPTVEDTLKGEPTVLIRNGEILEDALKKNFITKRELYNELYAQLHVNSLKMVESAIIENDGTIHFIKKNKSQ